MSHVSKNSASAIEALAQRVVAGERGAVARALRLVDDAPPVARKLGVLLAKHLRGAQILGLTGNPGAGKSTVVDGLIRVYRSQGKSVAVLAVDPSSPFSGGAILGDRIRMSQHASDDGVFIRSMATRGALGGLSRATVDSARVLDAAGFDIILIETVGVGQDEVDIARLAETTVVVLVPGLGDDVQAIKAGLLEVADVFLINKADRDGVGQLERSIRQVQSLAPQASAWEPPVLRSVASRGEGLVELAEQIALHRDFMQSPEGKQRALMQRRELFERLLDNALVEQGRFQLGQKLPQAVQRLQAGGDPYAEVLNLVPPVVEEAP